MDAGPADTERPQRSRIGVVLRWVWRAYARLVRLLVMAVVGTLLLAFGVLFINYVVLSTPTATAYRNLDPALPACRDGLAQGWTILADLGRDTLRDASVPDDGGWEDSSNDERAAVSKDPAWRTRLRCALQRHVVPSTKAEGKPLDYHLGFLEFQETGEPYALISQNARGSDAAMTSAMLRDRMHDASRPSVPDAQPVITQLDALKQHLSNGSHYVIVFIHGWRHDARIGDGNVADIRLYAAHAARFLRERCPIDPSACAMKVTAIYIGWRGARVDEKGLKADFGEAVGGFLGNLSAGATLFDRKPVSEAIAPAAVSALRTLEGVLAPPLGHRPDDPRAHNRMVIAGHSLGGNMLATGLKDDLVKAVRRHKPGQIMPPVLGNLVLLINPASEATKWTAIQREVWSRTATHADPNTPLAEVQRDTGFFPAVQKPLVVSVTAALAFPAGGLRAGDCAWIGLDLDDDYKEARARIRDRLKSTDTMFDAGVDYDWATHDLFPTFKFDYRPAAGWLGRAAARIERRRPDGESCTRPPPADWLSRIETLPIRALALLARTFPFQDSSREDSHTIGNLDPPRPAAGVLADAQPSASPFGTTHELLGLNASGAERHHPYATLADAPIPCPPTNRWLTRARAAQANQFGLFWDSEALAPADRGVRGQGVPAAEFLHGLQFTGIAPITAANDPFWNVRAFDNALSRHDGYRLSSFICAMNQLVLDDITGVPADMISTMR
ncbi:hypothetical protein [Methylobacterium haplocladii]|uniref:hypothetical protein n=1 Tax=Methylobacterium haplocladii TaxID=1176176 RepID=UPI001EE08124|nr:hypothetical protein [Methylobacterium haplocladii]GJD83392.1 hypothetical protein HPGCJGGD_1258 [Methylobacterium haplocladii]